MCSSGRGRCSGLLAAISIAYFIGLWQGVTFCKKIGPVKAIGEEHLVAPDALGTGPLVHSTADADAQAVQETAEFSEEMQPAPEDWEIKALEENDPGHSADGRDRAGKFEGATATSCSKFQNVDFPLEAWPASVRAEGESVYGTGWAQKFLRDHQFPENCEGKSFVEHGMHHAGMGSNMHIAAAILAFALNEGKIYQWPKDDFENPWTRGETKYLPAKCPTGQPSRNFECFLKPVSSCQPNGKGYRFTGLKGERGESRAPKSPPTALVPKVFKDLLKCSGYPKLYWPKWWRAQVTAFLLRPNEETILELQEFRQEHLVGQMQAGVLGCYVRHGDKYYEATEYPLKDYMEIFYWILDDKAIGGCRGAEKVLKPFETQLPKLRKTRRLYLGSDDAEVVKEANLAFPDMIYVNQSRLSKRMSLMRVSKKLGAKQMVMESLLNLQLLMESDGFICTWSSNWCRVVDEMRMTVGMKAAHLSIEVNKHCPRFNWVHGKGLDTPDF